MKINVNILAKSIWDVIKYPLLGMGTVSIILGYTALWFSYLGPAALPVTIATVLFGLLIMAICLRYKDLMVEHNKKQKELVDILRR